MKKRVLIFPCGSEIGLEVYRALKYNKDFTLIGGSSVNDHGKYVFGNYIENIPSVDDKNFIDEINRIINENKIDLLYPAHDSVVLKFSENAKKLNAVVVTSEFFTCDICRSKGKTYEYFKNIILTPKLYKKSSITQKDFPIFLKPDVGQGSKGTKMLNNEDDLNYYYKDSSQLLLEYLPYDEYTIDCFTDFNGNLKLCSGRKRARISNGISVNTEYIYNPNFEKIANLINSNLKFNGAWFFQLKENSNHELSLLEIAPRIAGTMEYQRCFGINLPLLNLYNSCGINVDIIKNSYSGSMDRALESKFKLDINYNYIYIDLDDVIIQNKKVNYEVIAFLYKSKNENKKIYLLTRHFQKPELTLEKYQIYNLFDKIIHINDTTPKSKFITHNDSIFIDDSFKERKDVFENSNIPVFDVNMIDILLCQNFSGVSTKINKIK